jgi:VIT1/CCC1 family predicted Fe2+/Mn2+ transporter
MYERKGLSRETARRVAEELTAHDALAAHADIEFGIDPDNLTNPWHAAFASMVAFTVGALLPLLVITLTPLSVRVWATVVTVALALAVAGVIQARLGFSPIGRAVARNVAGGLLAMVVTYGVGSLVGAHV